ncbi:uncharacterized protein LOC144481784 [Mustelus asterias]
MAKPWVTLIMIFQGVYELCSSLSQSPFAMTAEVGQNLELFCHFIYEVELVSSFAWFNQRVGEGPMPIDTTSCTGDDCKFISKKGNQENVLILEMRNIQVNDSGTYYCAHVASYAQPQKAVTLLVGDSSTNKSAVLVFVPPGELDLNDAVLLVCLVSEISSNRIAIFWNISGLVTHGWSDPGTMAGDGTYSIRSHIIVSSETWRSGGVCTCIAQLGTPGIYWTKSVSSPKTAATDTGWCSLKHPIAITVLVILILLLVLLSIWVCKSDRTGGRSKEIHNENVTLAETTSRRARKERQTGYHGQTQTLGRQDGTSRSQDGPLYASLDLVALEHRSKKASRR